ncbi:MAG TPA: Rossmann-like and DUF2520 domain-containing protein [Bryobacteraceae bacterium]|nr:Rossmann-like and DUF2520 domain-containing protein [Bryobacteraceae bacterium]
MLPSIGIAGSGRVAQAIGRLLREHGEPVTSIAGRNPEHTREAAAFIGGGVEAVALEELPRRAAGLLIAVSDDALEEVASVLAVSRPAQGVALHTCGSAGPEALLPLRMVGFACGTLHPLQTISSPEQGLAALHGAAFAVSGDTPALDWAEHLAGCLGGTVLRIPAEARPLYHAAAVMASNYVVSLIDAARCMLAEASGADPEAALRALAQLVRAAVANTLEHGPEAALTGPIERGDAGTLWLHLEALAQAPPHIRELYRAAGLHTLELARRKGLAALPAQRMEEMLQNE